MKSTHLYLPPDFQKKGGKKNTRENKISVLILTCLNVAAVAHMCTAATRTWLHCATHYYYYYYYDFYWASTWFASSLNLLTASVLQRAHWLEEEQIPVVNNPNACLRILTGRPVSCLHARTPMESLILKTKRSRAFLFFCLPCHLVESWKAIWSHTLSRRCHHRKCTSANQMDRIYLFCFTSNAMICLKLRERNQSNCDLSSTHVF